MIDQTLVDAMLAVHPVHNITALVNKFGRAISTDDEDGLFKADELLESWETTAKDEGVGEVSVGGDLFLIRDDYHPTFVVRAQSAADTDIESDTSADCDACDLPVSNADVSRMQLDILHREHSQGIGAHYVGPRFTDPTEADYETVCKNYDIERGVIDVHQYYIVDGWLAKHLQEQGEVVICAYDLYVFCRQAAGQALRMDDSFVKIARIWHAANIAATNNVSV